MAFSFFRKKQSYTFSLSLNECVSWLETAIQNASWQEDWVIFSSRMQKSRQQLKLSVEELCEEQPTQELSPSTIRSIGLAKKKLASLSEIYASHIIIPTNFKAAYTKVLTLSDEAEEFVTEFNNILYDLVDFFPKRIEFIKAVLKNINVASIRIRSVFEKEHAEQFFIAFTKIEEYYKVKEARNILEQKRFDLLSEKSIWDAKLQKIFEKKEKMKASHSFSQSKKIDEELVIAEKEFDTLTRSLKTSLQPIKESLLKYDKQLGTNLFKDPITIIAQRPKEVVIKSKELVSPSDEKKKKRFESTIKKIQGSWFEEKSKVCQELFKENDILKNRRQQDTSRLFLEEQERFEKSAKEERERIKNELDLVSNDLERMSLSLARQRIRDEFKKIDSNIQSVLPDKEVEDE